jgi:Na+(H+)/acetate symporter ActP
LIPILFVAGVVGGSLGVGVWGVRLARTTSDLYVASRAISPWWNAAAVSGEYLSAASFLGVAGLMMKDGAPALWQPVGFTAGYLALLLFVAAPLRRYGAFTISDFAEARLESPPLRLAAAAIVLGIGGLYLVPQLKGAGISVQAVTGAPYWVGIVAIAVVVSTSVALGGMRGITYVQAYQFWVKLFAIAAPAAVLLVVVGLPNRSALFGSSYPTAPAGGLVLTLHAPRDVTFPAASTFRTARGAFHVRAGAHVTLPAGRVRLPAGAVVPAASGIDALRGSTWSRPVAGSSSSSPLFIYSLLIATVLGTMGLPHILVRFYTNPDGPTARRTTVNVLLLLGVFYAFPAIYGFLGRALAPGLYATGETDSVVLRLPELAWPGLGGRILAGLTAAGAFAAFISTSSGLLVSLAGTLSHDVLPSVRPRPRDRAARRRTFRAAVPVAVAAPTLLALAARGIDIGVLVGWAFALAAATFCPLFLLGIWWPGLTARGAAIGLALGGTLTAAAIGVDLGVGDVGGAAGALLSQPALIAVPTAFAAMILGSLLAGGRRVDADRHMLALHAPEDLGLEAYRPAPAAPGDAVLVT